MNPVLDLIYKHKSIRKYKNQPIEDEKLHAIIKAAQSAQNWCNGQHVSIIAIKDQARKKKMEELCNNQKFISQCSVFLIFCADFYRTKFCFEKNGKSEEFNEYMTHIDNTIIGSHEVGIAIQNATIAAESLGLGVVAIGAVRINSLELTKELNLPKYVIPVIGLCVGYADDDPKLKPRLPMSAVFFEDKYDCEKAKSGVNDYDEVYKKYLAERDSNNLDSTWSKKTVDYYIQTKHLIDEDYDLLKNQGFISIDKK